MVTSASKDFVMHVGPVLTRNPFPCCKDFTVKEKNTPFNVKLMRSQALYWAVQEGA